MEPPDDVGSILNTTRVAPSRCLIRMIRLIIADEIAGRMFSLRMNEAGSIEHVHFYAC